MPAPKHSANTASSSASKTLASSFSSTLNLLGPFESRPHLAVAFSGGADSTALLLLARAWATEHKGTISALIVDHRLRTESTAEAQSVAAAYDAIVLTPEHAHSSNNLPEQAREWRYEALTQWCKAHDVLHLLIAHHADDQAETVALHMARGQTEDGASGMAAVSIRNGVRVLRPLLATHKSSLVAYLKDQNASWVEDPTNQNLQFKRNLLRSTLSSDETQALLATATREGAARNARDMEYANAAAAVADVRANHITLDATKFFALPEAIATRLLADSLCVVSGSHTRPRRHESETLYANLREAGFKRGTLKHCLVEKQGLALHITPEPRKTAASAHPKGLAASAFWWLDSRSKI